ncbi:hypothetical protein ACFQS7_06125 [Dankookia sp. GCM10030260]|uniref:hypothetical protein n=1 Tax=Dankookia sp. GCM10030260 TaxID=3273390 RepID=UPI003612C2C6
MPEAKPNTVPNPPLPGGEPAPDVGIGASMSDLAPLNLAPPAVPEADSPAFDAWLRRHLTQLHAGVLVEPVPDQMLRLLGDRKD